MLVRYCTAVALKRHERVNAFNLVLLCALFCYVGAEEKKEKEWEQWNMEMEKQMQAEKKAAESSSNTKTIVIVVVVVVLLISAIITGVAYQEKALCFKEASEDGNEAESQEEEATGESPLLKNANYSSRVSLSRTTTASTSRKSRPSSTTLQSKR